MDLTQSLIKEYAKKIYNFAYSKTRETHNAEDLSQEIIIQLCDGKTAEKDIENMDAYIYRICFYTWSNYLRKNKHDWEAINNALEIDWLESKENIEESIITKEIKDKLRQEIMFLSKLRREITIMFYYENKSGNEISKILGIPSSTVRWHLRQMKIDLKERLEMCEHNVPYVPYVPVKLIVGHSGWVKSNDMNGLCSDLLIQNICWICRQKALTIEDIARTLGVAAVYLEDKIEKLLYMDYMKKVRMNTVSKYQFEKEALLLSYVPKLVEKIASTILILFFLYSVTTGQLKVGDFVFLYRMMWRLTWAIMGIVDIVSSDLVQSWKYIDKYDRFVGSFGRQRIEKIRDTSSFEEACASTINSLSKNLKYGEFDNITLENVSYSYPSQKGNVVENINLWIKKGEIVSIIGFNGSGKSTLSKLICGLLEDYSGTIKLNGRDISKLNREDLYKYFGIGFQDFTKYSISLKDNIGIGMIEDINNEDEINKAIKKGNLQHIIDNLPDGIDTILGKEYDPNGQELSGGQWQRIILARAYMGEPEVLILDEPTASIDPIEEMRMLEYFGDIIKDKTAILISHRIGFARLSNRICFMDNGRIVEDGTHEELLALRGKYYRMFISQQQLYAKEGQSNG